MLTAPPPEKLSLRFECWMEGDRLVGVVLKDVDGDAFALDPRTALDLRYSLREVAADFRRVRTPGFCKTEAADHA